MNTFQGDETWIFFHQFVSPYFVVGNWPYFDIHCYRTPVSKKISSEEVRSNENLNIRVTKDTESIWVDVGEDKDKLLFGLQYRPPKLDKDRSKLLWDEIRKATRQEAYILGDYNLRNISWLNYTGNEEAREFLEAVQDSFLTQLVREGTREDNILDLVLTNVYRWTIGLEVGDRLGSSDHREIRLQICSSVKHKVNSSLVPDFRKADFKGLKQHLRRIHWGGEHHL